MTVEVSDPAFVYDLLYSLKRDEYAAAQTGRHTLEVRVPWAATSAEAASELDLYLVRWRSRHPGVDANVLERV
jgi:hypothetical protein